MIMDDTKPVFPVGYHSFHRDQLFNFQLNRWYSFGYARYEDMLEAGQKIETFGDWKKEMLRLANIAVADNRLINAAFYYRAAEFYTLIGDTDKELLYDKFISYFNEAFVGDRIERVAVPYQNAFLPAMHIQAKGNTKGIIVMHGGFDSFIDEFYSWMKYFSSHGYEVIAFEGPGQGAARKKYGLALDYQWEKPVKAVLDHFHLEDVTLLGISMGGWFCFRAAAFEPRIKRVIASSIAYDYMKFGNAFAVMLFNFFTRYMRDYSDKITLNKMRKEMMHAWTISNLMYITNKTTPMDALDVAMQLNSDNLHSELVKQDVLILTGKEDHFIPFKMHTLQVKALTNAESVTGRIFTRVEQAQNHCQVGNTGLALNVMVDWIESKS
jgi:pimeloyl-ACP methyl ester carboxylesterase